MKAVITGGAGFLGSRLCEEILKRGELTGRSGGPEAVDEVVTFDILPAAEVSDDRVKPITGDISDPVQALALIDAATDTVFHLGAMVSGGAEADFDLGYRSNLDGTRCVLEACRRLPHSPRVIFTSSVAAYGGKLPEVVDDFQGLVDVIKAQRLDAIKSGLIERSAVAMDFIRLLPTRAYAHWKRSASSDQTCESQ